MKQQTSQVRSWERRLHPVFLPSALEPQLEDPITFTFDLELGQKRGFEQLRNKAKDDKVFTHINRSEETCREASLQHTHTSQERSRPQGQL